MIRATRRLIMVLNFVLLFTFSLKASAGGNGSTGGNPECSEFSEYMNKALTTLIELDADIVRDIDPAISLQKLKSIKNHPFKCLPAEKLDRTARSNPTQVTTYLKYLEWRPAGFQSKLRLVSHELAVLALLDGEGEYEHSNRIYKGLLSYSEFFNRGITFDLVDFRNQPNEEVSFVNPKMIFKGQSYIVGFSEHVWASDPNIYQSTWIKGVCFYLGFGYQHNRAPFNLSISPDQSTKYAKIDRGLVGNIGRFMGIFDLVMDNPGADVNDPSWGSKLWQLNAFSCNF